MVNTSKFIKKRPQTFTKRTPYSKPLGYRFVHNGGLRLKSIQMLFGGILLVLCIRLLWVGTVMHIPFTEWSKQNTIRTIKVPAPRGLIYDQNNTPLVKNIPENIVYIIPADFPKSSEKRIEYIQILSNLLSIDREEIESILKKYRFLYSPIELVSGVEHSIIVELKEVFHETSAVFTTQKSTREYIHSSYYSHILGYIAPINERNIESYRLQGYLRDEKVGVSGIENFYEKNLRGTPSSVQFYINAQGNVDHYVNEVAAEYGESIHLSLDHDMQIFLSESFESYLRKNNIVGGAFIVSKSTTGEILAANSFPVFDTNMFADGIRGDEVAIYNSYLNDTNTPFLNRISGAVYPPGSVFKIVTMAAILENDIIDLETTLNSPQQIVTTNSVDESLTYIHRDWKIGGHGDINIIQALAASSDTYFYQVSGGFEGQSGVGVEEITRYANLFYFGHETGIDLPFEKKGITPNIQWKKKSLSAEWVKGDTYNYAIGQGYLLSTPLQVHASIGAIANNGVYVYPSFIKVDEPRTTLIPLQDSTVEAIQQGLYEAIHSDIATASFLSSLEPKIAGKTGTAQYDNNRKTHAWFTSYAPYENPQIIVTVFLEGGGGGSSMAAPFAQKIYQYYFSQNDEL